MKLGSRGFWAGDEAMPAITDWKWTEGGKFDVDLIKHRDKMKRGAMQAHWLRDRL